MIDYSSPLFVSLLLYVIYTLLAVAVGLAVWSMVRSVRLQRHDGGTSHGVRPRRIALGVALFTVATLVVTWLTASVKPLSVNGADYDDPLWLRAADMLINSALVLIAVAAVAVALGMAGVWRNMKK